jgi:putative membrane protein
MKFLSVSAAALLGATLTVAAQAQQAQPRTAPSPSAPSPSASAIATPEYIQSQARGDMFEIEAGKIAQQRAQSADIKDFGRMMIDDHTQLSSKLQQAVQAGNVQTPVPKTLDVRHNQALDKLRNTSSSEFDQTYFQSQIAGHREMLALNQTYSQTGDNAALKQFSTQAIPVIQKHLSTLQQLASGESPSRSGTFGSSGSQDPGTGASSGAGMGEEQIQREPVIGPGGPRQFNLPARDDGGLRDD